MITHATLNSAPIADKPEFDQIREQLQLRNDEDAYLRRKMRQHVQTDVIVLTRFAYNVIASRGTVPAESDHLPLNQLWGMPISVVLNSSHLWREADRLQAEGKRVLVVRDPIQYTPPPLSQKRAP